MNKFLFSVILMLALPAAVLLQADAAVGQTMVEATAQWGPPTFGTPVSYVLQHSVNGGQWVTIATPTETSYTFMVTEGDSHRIRVAGVDAEGVQGPFCQPSEEYIPGLSQLDGPGQPGQPNLQ